MRRLLEQTFGGSWMPMLTEPLGWAPPVDIEEQDDAFLVEAELPGVRREDVSIELVGNELSITGEIKDKERKGVLRRRTRRIGRFEVTRPGPVAIAPRTEGDVQQLFGLARSVFGGRPEWSDDRVLSTLAADVVFVARDAGQPAGYIERLRVLSAWTSRPSA